MSTLAPRTKRQIYLSTVAGPADDGMPSATISTIDVDRESDILIPEGAQLRDFRRNPVVLFGHDHHSLPVGVATSIAVEAGKGLRATWRWLEGDPFAARVANAWNQKALNAISVGFLPQRRSPNEHGGWQFDEWTLLEFSIVPVPANPEALRTLKSLDLDGPPTVAHARALIASLDAQFRDGRTLSRGAERRVTAALATLRSVVRATDDDDADDHDDEDVVTLEDSEALAVVFGEDGSVTDVDRDALRAAVGAVVETEFAYATGRCQDGQSLLTRGKGDAVIDMDPDELLALIRTGLGAAIDAKLRYVTGRVD